MYDKISVLHGQGHVALVNSMGSDKSIVDAARVSYSKDSIGVDHVFEERDKKLLLYLMQNRHTSPFESVVVSFEVEAPIFIFRQWHRHRTWCVSGRAPVIFTRPCDGKSYPMSLEDVVRKWNPPRAARHRADQSALTLEEYNRRRLNAMTLRSPGGDVHLQDAWYSGEKTVYRLVTKYGEVTASSDHVFKTPDGSARICDLPDYVMAMVSVGDKNPCEAPVFSEHEICREVWREVYDGYEVSSLGRVRSYWGQGARSKRLVPILKHTSTTSSGRVVVGIGGRVVQVSQLVCGAFIGDLTGYMVLHKDGNPKNNRRENLYLGSMKENMRDSYVNGGRVRMREVPVSVLAVKKVGVEPTFDLTVSGDHWFVIDNLVVHNSYNEVSARYTELPDKFYVPSVEKIGKQHTSNKQMREAVELSPEDRIKIGVNISDYHAACRTSYDQYQSLLVSGWPRELARMILPVSTFSRMVATVNLHNLFHFLRLRLHSHAQWEIQQYALAMIHLVHKVAPTATEAFLATLLTGAGFSHLFANEEKLVEPE